MGIAGTLIGSLVVCLFLVSYKMIVMLMFTMVLVTIITSAMPNVAHLSVVCHQLVIEELDVFVFSHLALGLGISEAVNFYGFFSLLLDVLTIALPG